MHASLNRKLGDQAKIFSARFNRRSRRIVVELNSNLGIFFSPRDAEGLEDGTPEQLSEIEITPFGYGLHFPQLDADLYLSSLLEGVFGSARWTADHMGAHGGRSRTTSKKLAARANGQKGGLPRKTPPPPQPSRNRTLALSI